MLATRRHLIATTVLATMAATSVGAQATGAISSFHVPAQDVTSAVRIFAKQAGVQIVVSGSVAQGRRSHAVSGKMGTGEALNRMLEGTGLAAKATGDSTYVIVGGAPDPTPTAYDEADAHDPIVVTGAMVAQREAVAEKRNADNTVETLHANDVGKLPDQNVAEAIKRLPGLTAANDQGEGRYVVIRGIDPGLANVTLNGMTLPAPEPDGRQVKLDDIPSAMIQSVSVSKSLLASQDANAIAGEVAIRTKTAFDSKKMFFVDARASVGHYTLNNKTPYDLDATVGGRFGADKQFGAVISASYSKRPIESENYQGSSAWSAAGAPDGNGLRDYNLSRTRLGFVGNFDWHPNEKVKLYLRTSYSEFQDHETRDQNRLAVTAYDATTGVPTKGTATILVRRREENDHTQSAILGGDFSDVAGGTLSIAAGYTRAVKQDPLRSEFTFTTAKGGVNLAYDGSSYPYSLTPATAGYFGNASNFYFSKYNIESRYAYEQLWQGKLDYTHPLEIGDGSEFSFGAKITDRHKDDDHNKMTYSATSTKWFLNNVGYTGNTGFYGNQFSFGQRINYFAARDYLMSNLSTLATGSATTSGNISDSLASDYDVRERITAGYAQMKLKFGGLTLIPGVRVENTYDSTKAKIVNAASKITDGFNTFGKVNYTDVFPGLNAKYDVTKDLLLRGAVTTSIGRPNYPQLAPYVTVTDTSQTATAVSIGNPNLKPYRSVNLDASVEFYPAQGSIISAGIFTKSIDNPIYSTTTLQNNVTLGNVLYSAANVTQPFNADHENVTGVEFNVQHQFTTLPGALSGFGVSANFSHVWGSASAAAIRGGNVPLAYQSKNVGTAQLFYEKYGFATRLAFSYRSAYLDTLGSSAATDQYTDANGQLDLHVSYQIIPAVTVFGDAVNLTDAPWRRYMGANRNWLIEREHYGTQLRAGVQVHF